MLQGLVLLLCACVGCSLDGQGGPGGAARSGPRAGRPNLLLVTIDTLRHDRAPFRLSHRARTPTLDRLSEEGSTFTHAYAPSSWTAPSMASLFTSLWPQTHGILNGTVRRSPGDPDVTEQEVVPEPLTLWAELLKRRGYRTFGVSGNGHLSRELGFAQGFDRFSARWCDAASIAETLASWRDDILSGPPYFVWVHLLDPHAPYTERHPWIRRYAPDYEKMRKQVSADLVNPRDYQGIVVPKSPALKYLNALYDAEISHTDLFVDVILRLLLVTPQDAVILTADHGEQFLDHNLFGHGGSLFEEEVRVPLILRLPGLTRGSETIDAPVTLLDLLPTALDFLGIPAPATCQGRSLLPLLRGQALPDRPIYLSVDRGLGLSGIVEHPWKMIALEGKPICLYDHRDDPREHQNFLPGKDPPPPGQAPPETRPEHAARAAALLEKLEAHRARARKLRGAPAHLATTPEEVKRLKALGYIGR